MSVGRGYCRHCNKPVVELADLHGSYWEHYGPDGECEKPKPVDAGVVCIWNEECDG